MQLNAAERSTITRAARGHDLAVWARRILLEAAMGAQRGPSR
jgi:hypothetical protein